MSLKRCVRPARRLPHNSLHGRGGKALRRVAIWITQNTRTGLAPGLVKSQFSERAIQFAEPEGTGPETFSDLPAVIRAAAEDGEVVLYSDNVQKTLALSWNGPMREKRNSRRPRAPRNSGRCFLSYGRGFAMKAYISLTKAGLRAFFRDRTDCSELLLPSSSCHLRFSFSNSDRNKMKSHSPLICYGR